MSDDTKIIRELTPLLQEMISGRGYIALAGAHAKGSLDSGSDIDFHIVAEEPKPYEDRFHLIQSIADEDSKIYVPHSFDESIYGAFSCLSYRGRPIEIQMGTIATMNNKIAACLDGNFEIVPQTWTTNGYYTYTVLSELAFLQPLWDPNGILAKYKKQVATYPEKLRTAIIKRFWGRASTWIGNFHYESAIARTDILFTAPIVLHTILDMVQIIYAYNRVYFDGDKKLETGLSKLPYCPAPLTNHLEFLLCAKSDSYVLRKQYGFLQDIHDELANKIIDVLSS